MSVKNIKKRKIKILFILTLFAFVVVIISGLIFNHKKVYSSTYNKHIEVEVVKGDTLWNIAKENNPNNADIRKVVYKIMKFNKMDSANIKPGDIIKIPIE